MISFKKIVILSCFCALLSMFYVTTKTMANQPGSALVSDSIPSPSTRMKNATISEPRTSPAQNEHKTSPPVKVQNKTIFIPEDTQKNEVVNKTIPVVSETTPYSLKKLATNLHTLTNATRSQNNLNAFSYDEALAKLATKRSIDMATNNYFSHTSLDGCDLTCRFQKAEYVTLSFGENLAEYSDYALLSESDLAEYFINKWLKSSGHRKNLLSSDYTNEGIGIALNKKKIIVTVIFAKS